MNRKISIISLTLIVAAAVIFGLIFVNKGDSPVDGMIMSDKTIIDVQDYKKAESSEESGQYIVLDKEFNKLNEKTKSEIPSGKDVYANIYIVESPKGSKLTVKWISEGRTVKEEMKELSTNQQGVISSLLEGNKLKSGSYTIELYSNDRKIFKYDFSI